MNPDVPSPNTTQNEEEDPYESLIGKVVAPGLKREMERYNYNLAKIPSEVMEHAIRSFIKHFKGHILTLTKVIPSGLAKVERRRKKVPIDDAKKAFYYVQELMLDVLGQGKVCSKSWLSDVQREVNALVALTIFCELKAEDYKHMKIGGLDIATMIKAGVLKDESGALKLDWNLLISVNLDSFMKSMALWFPGFHLDMTGKKWYRLLYYYIGSDKGKKDDFDKVSSAPAFQSTDISSCCSNW